MGIIDFFYDLYDGKRNNQREEEFRIDLAAITAVFFALTGLMLRYVTPDKDATWQTIGAWVGWPALGIATILIFLHRIAEKGRSDRKRAKERGERRHQQDVAWRNELELERLRAENAELRNNQCPPTNSPRNQRDAPRAYH
ncbi:hypothetical protein KC930_00870 [Candidatus Saccharibacteria bacterium]|nr:hypothetical protein [Candidatus Saccharibacteria bacterium]